MLKLLNSFSFANRIYIASSWRNPYYPKVVKRLRQEDHDVYDFRNPPHGGTGFHWTDIDENAPNWTFEQYAEELTHPLSERQFAADLEALQKSYTCVLVLPCGRSAHTEAGWMAGAGKRVIAYILKMVEPELMYKAIRQSGWQSGRPGKESRIFPRRRRGAPSQMAPLRNARRITCSQNQWIHHVVQNMPVYLKYQKLYLFRTCIKSTPWGESN